MSLLNVVLIVSTCAATGLALRFRFHLLRERGDRRAAAPRDGEARYRELADNAPDIMYRLRIVPERSFEYVSPVSTTILGYTPEQHYADPRLDYKAVHPEDRHLLGQPMLDAAESRVALELRWQRPDGVLVWIEHSLRALRDADGNTVALEGIARDITWFKKHEAEVHAQDARFRALIENASDVIGLIDADARIQFVSPSVERVLGRSPAEMLASGSFEFLHPEDLAAMQTVLAQAARFPGQAVAFTVRGQHRDGSWRTMSGTATHLVDDPAVRGIVINMRDLTDERRLESQFRQAQKMEAVGRLAGGIAHDFNNLLTTIKGNLTFALEDLGPDHPVRADLAQVEAAADSAASLTRQLLTFSSHQVRQFKLLNLNEELESFGRLIRRVVGEDIDLRICLTPGQLSVHADPAQLQQVFMNLVVNARDAMPTGGVLTIATRFESRDGGSNGDLTSGDYVVIAITDSGTGMPPDVRDRIFDPFFTTKDPGKGTGLGLSTVYGIVKQSGGEVRVHSEEGKGTTFEVFLPSAIKNEVQAAEH